jgi:hypothetical protein
MSLISKYFGKATRAIREPHLGYPFELSPSKAAIQFAEPKPNSHRTTESDWFNLVNFTDDRKPHRCETSARGVTG